MTLRTVARRSSSILETLNLGSSYGINRLLNSTNGGVSIAVGTLVEVFGGASPVDCRNPFPVRQAKDHLEAVEAIASSGKPFIQLYSAGDGEYVWVQYLPFGPLVVVGVSDGFGDVVCPF